MNGMYPAPHPVSAGIDSNQLLQYENVKSFFKPFLSVLSYQSNLHKKVLSAERQPAHL